MEIELGTVVAFSHRGATHEGRVVGSVQISGDWRRRAGWWFNVQPIGCDWLPVHESQLLRNQSGGCGAGLPMAASADGGL